MFDLLCLAGRPPDNERLWKSHLFDVVTRHERVLLTCLNPLYMMRISCLVNLVCRHRSSNATGRACWNADGLLSCSSSSISVASSMIGLSGGVAIARWPPESFTGAAAAAAAAAVAAVAPRCRRRRRARSWSGAHWPPRRPRRAGYAAGPSSRRVVGSGTYAGRKQKHVGQRKGAFKFFVAHGQGRTGNEFRPLKNWKFSPKSYTSKHIVPK